MQMLLWSGAAVCAAIAGLAVFADHRRERRADLDRVGWVPWPLLLVIALMATAVCVAFALQSG
jgi:drug/metabolite transporter (DMT)-like permease